MAVSATQRAGGTEKYLDRIIGAGLLRGVDTDDTPDAFAERVTKGRYVRPPHVRLLGEKLAAAAKGEIRRLLVSMPPRHSKSETCSHYAPAWFLGKYPDKRVILTSYEADFAASWGRKVRTLLEDYGFDHFGLKLSRDSSAADRWDIAGYQGGMFTAGVGGPITGKGFHLGIIDDPIKNAEEAASETIREKIWDWYLSTFYTRQEPGAAICIIMTRWHDDDLAGRVLERAKETGEHWEVIDFPAIALEQDILGRQPGEALWPERYPVKELEQIKTTLGGYHWAALYQQNPQPEGGSLFKSSEFRYFRNGDGYYILNREGKHVMVPWEDCWRFQTVDAAAEEKKQNDYFVCATFAVTPANDLLVLNVFREKAETTKHRDIMFQQYNRWAPAFQGVEDVTYGKNIIQECLKSGLPIKKLKADKDKVSRARNIQARYQSGKVYHLLGAPWLEDFENELLRFPTGKHDDQVDPMSYAGIELSTYATGEGWQPEEYREPEDDPNAGLEHIEADPNRANLYY